MKNNKPIILFIARQIGTTGGAERRLLQLLSSPLQEKFELISYSFLGVLDVYLKIPKNRLVRNLQYIGRLIKLWHFLRKEQPDLIHSFDLESGIYIKIIQNYLFTARGAKVIIGYGANSIEHKATAKFLSRREFQPNAYTCNSEAGRTSLLATLPHPAPEVHVIYNGLNTVTAQTEVPKWRKNHALVVGCISKFDNNKCGERIFEIAELTAESRPDIHFVFIGTGGQYNLWKEHYDKNRTRYSNLTLLGVVQDAMKLVHYFDIGILFSEKEGFPNAVLEYMLCAKPVITTSAGESASMIRTNDTGILLNTYNKEEFTNNILLLANQPELRNLLGQQAKSFAEQHFSFSSMTERFAHLYDSQLNR